MSQLIDYIRQFLQYFRFWFVIEPWEQALRVRLGKKVALFKGGIHFKIPLVDNLYIQTTRLRMITMDKQTLSTLDGKTITICSALSYCIEDLSKLFNTLHHADVTIVTMTEGLISEYIASHNFSECDPVDICAHINKNISFSSYGLGNTHISITQFAVVKTYRIIGDGGSFNPSNELGTQWKSDR